MSNEPQLLEQLHRLQTRFEALEAERLAERRTRVRQQRWLAAAVVSATVLGATFSFAANGNCPNGLPFCFGADTPAEASQVNHNFAQLKEWIELKVGATNTANVRMQAGPTSNVATASGKTLFVSGVFGDGASDNGGIEFRHDNLTAGIGFGWDTIYATGSNVNQNLRLKSRGPSGMLILNGNTNVTNNFSVTGTVTAGGDLIADGNAHGTCYETGYECGWIYCAAGYYMVGLDIAENENCGGGGDFDFSPFAVRCCRL